MPLKQPSKVEVILIRLRTIEEEIKSPKGSKARNFYSHKCAGKCYNLFRYSLEFLALTCAYFITVIKKSQQLFHIFYENQPNSTPRL